MIEATRRGLEELVAFILTEKCVDVNEVFSRSSVCCTVLCLNEACCTEAKAKGFTALMLAARNGNVRIAGWLLGRHDVDVNTMSKNNQTALILAAQRGHEEIAQLLLKREDVDVNVAYRPESTRCTTCRGHISHTCYPQLAKARGSTALMLAAQHGHCAIVRQLLKRHDIDVNATDEDGKTALMLAAQKGRGIVALLLMNREDLFIHAEDKWCNTASEMASNYQVQWHISTEDELVMKLILCGGDDFVNDIVDGRNALMVAVIRGFALAVRLLLKSEAIDVNAKDRSGQTALMMAAERDDDAIVKMLLKRPEIAVNIADKYGSFALLTATQLGHENIVMQLLKMKFVQVNAVDKNGRSPLMYAAMHGHAAIAEQLLDHPDIDLALEGRTLSTQTHMTSAGGS